MSQKYQPLASRRKHSAGLGKMVFMLFCLALPAVSYLVTGHPAFMVIFIIGMIGISVTMARMSSKK